MSITLFIDTLKVFLLLSVFSNFTSAHTRLKKYILCSSTDSGINAPQRKKEIERYGEREKLYICLYSKLLSE